MKAELITIGNEILIGQVVNTNAGYLSKHLNEIGIHIEQITAIADSSEALITTLNQASQRADIIVITGGLGPTNDDITKHTLCKYFNDELILYPDILRHIEAILKKHIAKPISDRNREQAQLPKNAKIFKNAYGTASGMWFERDNKVYISLPGVPLEMKELMEHAVIPELQKCFSFPFIYHKTILTHGLEESEIASRIERWENALPPWIKLAYLPGFGQVKLRLSAKGNNAQNIENQVNNIIAQLLPLIKDILIGFENSKPLNQQIGERLTELKRTISVAESCTGGKLSSAFTTTPGASAYFLGGIVAYTTNSKTQLLNISRKLIKSHGTVSAAVAKAMAIGVQKKFNADYALSTTGNAGPSLGDPNSPLGTVFVGFAHPKGIRTFKFQFGNHREKVIEKAINKALEILHREVLGSTMLTKIEKFIP